MTSIASAPHILRDVDLTIGTDQYQAHVSSVALTPSNSQVTWQGLTPAATFSGTTSSTWTCVLAGVQDWATADSLAEYLFENDGEEVPISFTPRSGTGSTFEGFVTCAPPNIGGDINTVPVFSVTLGMRGKPTKAPTV